MSFINKIKSRIPAFLLGGFTLFGGVNSDNSQIPQSSEKNEQKQIIVVPTVKNPLLRLEYQTDTLETRSSILLYNQNGKIYRHYKEGDPLYDMHLNLFVHEAWHTHNLNLGFRKYKFSPQEYRNLLIHDEITASLAALNSLILEYSFADNKKEFLQRFSPNGYYSFYFNEVSAGRIDPLSKDSAMLAKDYSLRVNGMIKTWMNRSYPSYCGRHKRMLLNYIRICGLYKDYPKTYQKMLHDMYKIGGIDFWKYAEEDIKPKDARLIDNLAKLKSYQKDNKSAIDMIDANSYLLEKIDDDEQRTVAVQHLIMSAEIKALIKKNNFVVDDKIATILYNKVKTNHSSDKTFARFAEETSLNAKKLLRDSKKDSLSLDDFIHKVYNLDGVDLSKNITNFENYNIPYKPNKKFWDADTEMTDFPWLVISKETIVANIRPEIKSDNHEKPKNPTVRGSLPRRSGIQYVTIPNFWEPILTSATPEQTKQLKQLYIDFHNSAKQNSLKDSKLQDITLEQRKKHQR